jgi:hypothetical protein
MLFLNFLFCLAWRRNGRRGDGLRSGLRSGFGRRSRRSGSNGL